MEEGEPRPPTTRQRSQFQCMADLFEERAKRRQTITAADMFKTIDQADPVHGFLVRTIVMGFVRVSVRAEGSSRVMSRWLAAVEQEEMREG
jgi:hypothetical protein